jgi:hypothetical protein
LRLEDLEYELEMEDPLLAAEVNLFREPLRRLLEAAANQQLQQQLDGLELRLAEVLETFTPAGMTLDLSALRLQAVRIELDPAGVQLQGTVTGHAVLDWR